MSFPLNRNLNLINTQFRYGNPSFITYPFVVYKNYKFQNNFVNGSLRRLEPHGVTPSVLPCKPNLEKNIFFCIYLEMVLCCSCGEIIVTNPKHFEQDTDRVMFSLHVPEPNFFNKKSTLHANTSSDWHLGFKKSTVNLYSPAPSSPCSRYCSALPPQEIQPK